MQDSKYPITKNSSQILYLLKVIISIILSPFLLTYYYVSLLVLHIRAHKALHLIEQYTSVGHSVCSETTRDIPLVVSLSSTLTQFNHTLISLCSIFKQDIQPDKLILFLSDEEYEHKHLFSKKFDLLKKIGVDVLWTQSDSDIYSRIIPAIERNPNAVIVAMDHMYTYSTQVLENFYRTHLEHPKDIISPNCLVLTKVQSLKIEKMEHIKNHTTHLLKDSFILNTSNMNFYFKSSPVVLLPPQSLHHSFNKDIYLELAPNHADVWLNAMAILKGTEKYFFDFKIKLHSSPILNPKQDVLVDSMSSKINTKNSEQDIDLAIKRVFDYFDVYPRII